MLILIILVVAFVVGILLIVATEVFDCGVDIFFGIGVAGCFLSFFTVLILGIIILSVQVPKQKDYQNKAYEREVLVYRLEQREENIVGNEMLYSEIVDFNNSIRTEKTYADSIWIGLFFNDLIATIDYIEI